MRETADRKRGGRPILWGLWAIIAISGILTGVLAFFTHAPGEKLLANILEKQLRDFLRQNVQIGALETNLFTRVQIFDLLISASNADSIDLLSLARCKIDFQLSSLISGKFVLETVNLSGLKFSILRDSSGALNLPQFLSTTETNSQNQSPPVRLQFQNLKLNDGCVSFADDTGEFPSVKIVNLQAMISLEQDSSYHCHLQIDTNRVEYRNSVIDVQDLLLVGTCSGPAVSIDTLECSLPGMMLTALGSILLINEDTPLSGRVQLLGDPGELISTLHPLMPGTLYSVQGEVDLSVEIQGSVKKPEMRVFLDSPSLAVARLELDSLQLIAGYSNQSCTIEKLSGRAFNGQFNVAGTFQLDSLSRFDLNSSLSNLDIASIWRLLYDEKSPYKGQLEGHLKARGDLKDYKQTILALDVHLKEASYRGKRIDDFQAVMGIERGTAHLRFTGEAAQGGGSLRVVGQNLSGEFAVNFEQVNPLAGFLNLPTLVGTLKASGYISGSIDSPEIEAIISADRIRYQNVPIDSMRGRVQIRGQELFIDELVFWGGLTVGDTSKLPFNTAGLSGAVSYFGSVQGAIDNPEGDLTVMLHEPAYRSLRFDEGIIRLSFAQQQIRLSPLELSRDSVLIQLYADFDMNAYIGTANLAFFRQAGGAKRRTSAELSRLDTLLSSDWEFNVAGLEQGALVGELNCRSVAFLSAFLPDRREFDGALKLTVEADGLPDKLTGEIYFNLNQAKLGSARLDSIRGNILLGTEKLSIPSIEFFLGNHRSWLATDLGLILNERGWPIISSESAVQGEAYGVRFPLAVINPFLPKTVVIDGTSSYSLSWEGTLGNVLPMGTVSVDSGLAFLGEGRPVFQDLFMNLIIAPDRLYFDRLEGYLGGFPFKVDGSLTTLDRRSFDITFGLGLSDIGRLQIRGIVSPENIAVTLKSQQLNLKSIRPFFPALLQIEGVVNTQITIDGSLVDPQIDGFIDIRDLTLQAPPPVPSLTDGVVRLRFNRNNVVLDSLICRVGEGWMSSQGTFTHENRLISRIDLKATLRNVAYEQSRRWAVLVNSADLRYHGEADKYYLDGDVVLGKSKVLIDFQPQALLPFARSVERPVPELPDFITKTQLDIRIRDSEELWIDNNIARLRLHPEIEIIGLPMQLSLAGRLAIEEGYVLFLDRKFKMSRGIIDFIDPERINPVVDIQAEAIVRNYQDMEVIPYDILLKITGPIDELVVELTSDPPLERSDIVSLLTLGATRQQLSGTSLESDDPSKTDILRYRAGELSSRKITGYLSKNITDMTGLDDVSLEGNLFSFGKSWGPRLIASKKITDRMEVTYSTNVGHLNERSVRVDYRLSKYFWIESETDQQGKAGLDLKYKIKLK